MDDKAGELAAKTFMLGFHMGHSSTVMEDSDDDEEGEKEDEDNCMKIGIALLGLGTFVEHESYVLRSIHSHTNLTQQW